MTEHLRVKTKALLETAELKRIYSSIEASVFKSDNMVIAITSASSGEGKTTILAGLAALAAQHYKKKVLAMDMNWYAPGLHSFFGLDLVDAKKFSNGNSLNNLIQQTEITNLHVLCAAGAPEDNAGLHVADNTTLKTLINKARELYNIVLIDTSKVFPLNRRMIDPVEVAKNADGAVLVVLTNGTPRQMAKKARFALETAGVKILGVIVNQWQNPLV
jgi:Mrp family chromosome partitioning ATPase